MSLFEELKKKQMNREAGFYHVRLHSGEWVVAEWIIQESLKAWRFCGLDPYMCNKMQSKVLEIGLKIEPPTHMHQ